jgi:hypothetical protein
MDLLGGRDAAQVEWPGDPQLHVSAADALELDSAVLEREPAA